VVSGGREVFGFVPYWEMDDGIADHLAATPLTTIGVFSVTHTSKGAINTTANGYKKITGDIGRRIIREAHARGTDVELVYTSFGADKNRRLFGDSALQAKVIASLVSLVGDLGIGGIHVDVEGLDPDLVPAYGAFVADLRAAVVAADPSDRVTVSTGAGGLGAGMAIAAIAAGAERVFLMGCDYRTARSSPGATSPLENRDGPDEASLRRSLDTYAALGVPSDRLLLGLPLYGMTWPVAGPVIGAPSTGPGDVWILRKHADILGNPSIVPQRDDTEVVEVYLFGSDGTVGPPTASPSGTPTKAPSPTEIPSATQGAAPSATPGASPDTTWQAVYVDSPATLERKLALAIERGLAGAGFWAVGYERGLPGYTQVMRDFATGAGTP
jgi:spore germination protein YaaH